MRVSALTSAFRRVLVELPGHEVLTAREAGLVFPVQEGRRPLPCTAASGRFDAFITMDRSLQWMREPAGERLLSFVSRNNPRPAPQTAYLSIRLATFQIFFVFFSLSVPVKSFAWVPPPPPPRFRSFLLFEGIPLLHRAGSGHPPFQWPMTRFCVFSPSLRKPVGHGTGPLAVPPVSRWPECERKAARERRRSMHPWRTGTVSSPEKGRGSIPARPRGGRAERRKQAGAGGTPGKTGGGRSPASFGFI